MTTDSPFNWRSKPSIMATDREFNGINHRNSKQATMLKKTPFIINGKDPRTPPNQVNAYGRAVVSKPTTALGL